LAEGGWELLRYSAIADGDYSHPVTHQVWPDPLGREEGELLSPRFSREFYARQEENGFVWLSQFQGRPTDREGSFFKIPRIKIVDILPHDLPTGIRKWDFAASAMKGDFTVGVRMAGPDRNGVWYILDVVRGRWATEERNDIVMQTAMLDGREVPIHFDQDPGQAGLDQIRAIVKLFAGYTVNYERVSGSKTTRADPFASQLNSGYVALLSGAWNAAFIEELRQFPFGNNDDQVDAAAGGFNKLAGGFDLEHAEAEIVNAFSWR
jgi:predicted phage terminase large subunit-like protein